jgi:cytochrome c oxidase cbb3-type subunit IV
MKFINYLESITGVGIYPLVSFLIFFFFFIGVTVMVIRADKKNLRDAAMLPLDNEDTQNQ